MYTKSCAVLVLALIGAAAHAQENIYVGIGYGSFDYTRDGTNPILGEIGDSIGSLKLFGGFELNDNFAIEISYGETSDLLQSASITADIFYDGLVYEDATVSGDLKVDFVTTALRAIGQFEKGPGVFMGGIGYFRSDADVRELQMASHPGLAESLSIGGTYTERDTGFMASLGYEWRFGRFGTRYGIRIEYEWWDVGDANASTVGLGVSYGF